jgi:hypothetical protein
VDEERDDKGRLLEAARPYLERITGALRPAVEE